MRPLRLLLVGTIASALAISPLPGTASAPPNVQINRVVPGSIDAHNSPNLAVNPLNALNIISASRVDRPDFKCEFRVTFDGGLTWESSTVPMPAEPHGKCYAPQPGFDAAGTAYMIFPVLTGAGNRPEIIVMSKSTDGGRTFGAPRHVLGDESFQVNMTIVGTTIYLTWLQGNITSVPTGGLGTPPNPILMSKSTDGGETFSLPTLVSDPLRPFVAGPNVAVTADGKIFVAYYDLNGDLWNYEGMPQGTASEPPMRLPYKIVLASSSDGGASFAQTEVASSVEPLGNFLIYIPPRPAIAAAPDGRIYVGWTSGDRGGQDIWVTSSPTGATWSAPIVLPSAATDEHTPTLAVAGNGRADLLYYSRIPSAPTAADTDVHVVSSTDGGATWGAPVILNDVRFDGDVGPENVRGKADLGNRIGLLSFESAIVAAWSDTRFGNVDSGKQDIFGTRLSLVTSPTPDTPTPGPGKGKGKGKGKKS